MVSSFLERLGEKMIGIEFLRENGYTGYEDEEFKKRREQLRDENMSYKMK